MNDLIAAGITFILGVVWLVGSFSLDQNNVGGNLGLGPGFYPRLISYLMIILSISYFIKSWDNKKDSVRIKISPSAIYMMVGCIAYLYLINVAGYIVTTFLYVLTFIYLLGRKILLVDVTAAVLIVTCLYGVFHGILKVPLPGGLLL